MPSATSRTESMILDGNSQSIYKPQRTYCITIPLRVGARFHDLIESAAGAALLIAASPAIALSAVLVTALSRQSPFIAHRRIGYRGRPFWMWKLRTMWVPGRRGRIALVEYIVDERGPELKSREDGRVTSRIARFCRRHSLDELPQLAHIARGEMALIGPRPVTVSELRRYYGAHAREVLSVKPGITGLWQVSGRSRLSRAERRVLDLETVRRRSLRSRMAILARTIVEVWTGEGAW